MVHLHVFFTSKIFNQHKKWSFAISTDRDRGKVLCPFLFPSPVPACCPSKKLGCLVHHYIVLQRNPPQHPFVFLLKTLALVISDAVFFLCLGNWESMYMEMPAWKGIAAWAKTWDLNTQLCPNCIESETWPVTAGQVTRNSFSFGFWLYHNTHSKQQQKLWFRSWRDLSFLKKHQGNFLVMLVKPKRN